MFTLSAFTDEIDPDPLRQVDVLAGCEIRFIELRSAFGINVLRLSDRQLDDVQAIFDRAGIGISAIGSPIGKVPINAPFEPHLADFERAIAVAKRFGTRNIRIFSFYPPGDAPEVNWASHREEVIQRLGQLAHQAADASVRLLHENEHRIFGDSPDRVMELAEATNSPAFALAFDPANFVVCGWDPWDAWGLLRERVVHLHIKDWAAGETHGRVAGDGQGRLRDILADAVARGYDGFATLEPHLLGGGPTGGVTGAELFPSAVSALRNLIREVGGQEQVT